MNANSEKYSHQVRRFTKTLILKLNNHLQDGSDIKVTLRLFKQPEYQNIIIQSGNSATYTLLDVQPGVPAYEFYICA